MPSTSLGGGEVEQRGAGAPEPVVPAELRDADDGELLRRSAEQHADPVTDGQCGVGGAAGVDGDLVRRSWRPAAGEADGLVRRRDAHAVVRLHPGADGLAVLVDHQREAADGPGGAGDAGHLPDLVGEARRAPAPAGPAPGCRCRPPRSARRRRRRRTGSCRRRRTRSVKESVRTRVPLTNATPSAMDSAVMTNRSLWASSPLRATVSTGQPPSVFRRSRTLVGRRVGHLGDDAPVGQEHDAVGVARGGRVVRDHHDGLPELVHGPAQEAQQLGCGVRVERAGRLVGEDDLRPARQRPRRGDPLLLPAGQLARTVRQPRPQADGVDHRVEPRPVRASAGDVERQRDVLQGGQRRQQVERLEDEARGGPGAGA